MLMTKISGDAVKKICIQYNFYTQGTNEEYQNLLNKCPDNAFFYRSTEELEQMALNLANDILSHSDVKSLEEEMGVEIDSKFIAYLILNRALEFRVL